MAARLLGSLLLALALGARARAGDPFAPVPAPGSGPGPGMAPVAPVVPWHGSPLGPTVFDYRPGPRIFDTWVPSTYPDPKTALYWLDPNQGWRRLDTGDALRFRDLGLTPPGGCEAAWFADGACVLRLQLYTSEPRR